MRLFNKKYDITQEFSFKASNDIKKYSSWPVLSLLALTVFLVLQIAFLGEPARVPDPSSMKHVDGKLLRTALFWNRKMPDLEMLVRSDEGDVLIHVPSAGTIAESIKFIDKRALLSIDYYLTTNQGISTRRAWQIAIDGKPFVDYHYSTSSKNQLREFDIKFIALTAMVWVSLFLSILIMRLEKRPVRPEA
jgi:hypothetical protein